jgi:hypothetical protein
VEKLRSFEREYRSRLKNYLEGQLRELDGSTSSAPAVQGGQGGQPPQGQPPQGQGTPGQPARSPFAPGAPVGGEAPSGPPQQPQGISDGDQRG